MSQINITFNNQTKSYEKPVKILDVVGGNKDYVCAKVDGRVRELTYPLDNDCTIEVLTNKDEESKAIYEASLRFLVAMAMNRLYPNANIRFTYSISRSTYMEVINKNFKSNGQMVIDLEREMQKIVDEDIPLIRHIISKEEAEKLHLKKKNYEKAAIMKYRPEKTAHVYTCAEYANYMYNRMLPSTGYIKKWRIRFYHPGVIIQYPRSDTNGAIPPFEDVPTFGKTLQKAYEWGISVKADTVVNINKHIENEGIVDFINLCEARHNQQIVELGNMISDDIHNIRLICIAGPSSSGKTTFSNKLRIELLSRGIQPIRLSMDDYYLPREEAPLDKDGKPDLESVNALDIELFNKNMADLISGMEVELPKFDFKIGKRVKGRKLKVPHNQPIIIEGIHALNDLMTSSIPGHQKFKIFIAPQAQISIDPHNPLSLTDFRLLRRIVRDKQFRNSSALETIQMWKSVREGEFKWIYRFQESANYVFNSALVYELCVMKKYALPLLKEIGFNNTYYPIVERLIRMLKFFIDMPDDHIPCNSLIREFIGGSSFEGIDE